MPTSRIGESLFEALTQYELIQLLDSLWATLPVDLHNEVLAQLPSDTGQTVRHILSSPQPTGVSEPDPVQMVSIAKLAESWAKAWQMWDAIVDEASDEEGYYIAQEAHWEPPYFDQGGVKLFRIVHDIYRNHKPNFEDLVMETACGLFNLRLDYPCAA